MTSKTLTSPVSLNYLAALRGIKPRAAGTAFTYADLSCGAPEQLACLAASNPEGQFYGFVADDGARVAAEKLASERGVSNVMFKVAKLGALNPESLPKLDYICADLTATSTVDSDRKAVCQLAAEKLTPNGMLNLRYKTFADDKGALKFLVSEFAPEMNAEQAVAFLGELKLLGDKFLARHDDIAAQLEDALKSGVPDAFFSLWDEEKPASASFETSLALRSQGMTYLGDENIAENYMEMSLTPDAQKFMEQSVGHALYEPLKDYALARQVRSDVWVKSVLSGEATMPELFGGFVYGVTMPHDKIPVVVTLPGTTVSLAAPLYQKLIDVLTLVPASIGDFLSHPDGKGYPPSEVVGALQILIACGIAQPMRGSTTNGSMKSIDKPKLVGSYNRFLGKTPITSSVTWMASPVLGAGIAMTPRDALVIQALDRVGLADSVSALMPELERLAKNPAEASRIMDTTEPTPEMAQGMITDAVTQSILRWYAYGVLEAA
jgi:hypothetical protein